MTAAIEPPFSLINVAGALRCCGVELEDEQMAVSPILKFDDDQIIEALQATRCNPTEASILLARKWRRPCHRTYVTRTARRRPRLIEFMREYREMVTDQAEANLFRQVENGDIKASVLLVRTLGKDRGWVPRSEKSEKPSAADQVEAIARGRVRAKSGAAE